MSPTPSDAGAATLLRALPTRASYPREASHTADPELQKVSQELAESEKAHVRLLQQKLAEQRRATNSRSR